MNETNQMKIEALKHQLHSQSVQEQEELKYQLQKEID